MSKLPFVIQPKKNTEIVRIGNEDIGVVEIERRGYLTVAEKSFVDNVMQGSDGVTHMVVLANKIARQKEVTPEEAYMAIAEVMQGNANNPLEESISDSYGVQVSEIASKMAESLQRRSIAAATILIQSRINNEWSVEDTLKLDPQLVAEFNSFYEKEEQRVPVEERSKEKEAEEIVGK